MTDSQAKLKSLLRELFQLDNADLDFGIYRIMNAKRVEVERFLDNDLLPQVKKAFEQYQTSDSVGMKAGLDKLIQQLKDAGVDPESAPKVKELRAKLAGAVDVSALESQVFSDLYTFFRRYYSDGDFLSLRRYKEGVYAIPYEGEEVKLYWANHDQYYIKSSEYLRDYTFSIASGKRVHFKLSAADTEKDNSRAANGTDRRFVIAPDGPVVDERGELVISFTYRSDPDKRKQKELNDIAVKVILSSPAITPWLPALSALSPVDSDPNRTLLERHLTDYTSRNSFDYFIHKHLRSFLIRELDFYIKNEIVHLDDIDAANFPKVDQVFSRVRVFRQIAHKIIAFLAQLEDFQKTLWLKKKFVVDTHWLVSVSRVAPPLRQMIVDNADQWAQWESLGVKYATDDSLLIPGPKWGTREYLDAHPGLVVDTSLFPEEFTHRLLASPAVFAGAASLDDATTGTLFHSDNFQALSFMQERYREQIKCVYIDPPYNTGSSAILYKNHYRHSSWWTMMADRVTLIRELMPNTSAFFGSIDKIERLGFEGVLDVAFGADNHIEELIWTQNTANSQLPTYSTNHEYVEVYSKSRAAVEADPLMFREPKPGFSDVMAVVKNLNPQYPPIEEIERAIRKLYNDHVAEYHDEVVGAGDEWDDDAKKRDPWKGLFNYCKAEYRDELGKLVPENEAKSRAAKIWIWREISPSAPASKQADSTRDPSHFNYRYYTPPHPVTGKPCPHPQGGWKFPYKPNPLHPDRRTFVELDADSRIAWGEDETKIPQTKGYLHEVETNIATSVFYEYNDGEAEVSRLFGKSGMFLSPKSSKFVTRFIKQVSWGDDVVLDCFGGSGSTAHGVLRLNREDGRKRKFVIVEMGLHFNSIIKPRVSKVMYSPEWKDGKAAIHDKPLSGLVKVLRLESYEDALNNLHVRHDQGQESLLESNAKVREDYTLNYSLPMETRQSLSLLNVESLSNPFRYTLEIATATVGERKRTNVDLVETFNWLLGLRVKTIDTIKGIRVVTGTSPQGEKVLVLWRNVKEIPSQKLDEFFQKQGYNTKDMEFDVIYVNGDNNLENLKKDEDTWKVRLIEEDFKRLMFDVQDV